MELPIDPGIRETVAVLQLLGVHTRQSCEGHMDHGVAAPWIFIETPDPKLEELRDRYTEFCDKAEALEEGSDEKEDMYDALWELRGKMERIGALEYKKLIPYLEEFYQGRSVSYVRRLIINQGGRLTSQGMILQPTEKKKTRRLLLKEYQEEMRDFAEFLKQKFFSEESCKP